jgi:hypothetical protein
MALVEDLVSQGVSQTGAVEVVLGQPLSRVSDRPILTRLGIPAARESLRQGPGALTKARVDQRMAGLISKPDTNAANLEFLVGQASRLQQGTKRDPRIEALKQNIANTEREIRRLTQQLNQLLASPPPTSPLPPAVWEAQVRMLRSLLQNQRTILATFMQQLDGLLASA